MSNPNKPGCKLLFVYWSFFSLSGLKIVLFLGNHSCASKKVLRTVELLRDADTQWWVTLSGLRRVSQSLSRSTPSMTQHSFQHLSNYCGVTEVWMLQTESCGAQGPFKKVYFSYCNSVKGMTDELMSGWVCNVWFWLKERYNCYILGKPSHHTPTGSYSCGRQKVTPTKSLTSSSYYPYIKW